MAALPMLLVLLVVPQPQREGGLASWLREHRAGNADYDTAILHEAIRYGSMADGRSLIGVLERRFDAEDLAAQRGRKIQRQLLDDLARLPCSLGVQAAVLDRVERHAGGRESIALTAELLPLLGVFHPRFRSTLETFCGAADARLVVAAGQGLAHMRATESFAVLGKTLDSLEDPAHVAQQVRHLEQLLAAGGAELRHQRFVLDVVRDRIRARPHYRVREALLPVVRAIRAKATVPLLIGELEHTFAELSGRGAVATGMSFYLHELHAALTDLTGFWAPASTPERWRAFWEQEGEAFELRGKPPPSESTTATSGFFGIPVRGRRVLFVLDVSGSMRRPYGIGPTTRLDQAKKELLAAATAMDPDAEFNVILFSDKTRRFTRAFAPPSEKRLDALRRMLDDTVAGGSTNLLNALEHGLAGQVQATTRRSERSIDEVFVLSDGAPRTNPVNILESVARWNVERAARVNTIYIGDGDDTMSNNGRIPHGRAYGPIGFMKKLAEDNGGVFRTRPSS